MMQIRALTAADWPTVRRIYQAGIDGGNATFESKTPEWAAFDAGRLAGHRLVATDGKGAVTGWIVVSPTSARPVYAGVVDVSVYVDPMTAGRGIGGALVAALIASTEQAGVWTLQAGIFPENTASLALHRRAGFRDVGVRERLGYGHGRWRDVLLLERRSPLI